MAREEFDLCVIGGGINGAAIARDASLRGLSVALVEAGDFAGATSSRSSKLIHGGFRYLPQWQFRLVYHALRERERLRHQHRATSGEADSVFISDLPGQGIRPPHDGHGAVAL